MTSRDSESTDLRLERMERSIRMVRDIRARGLDALLASPDRCRVLERELQVALQACLDAGAGLLNANGDTPSSYAEVFERLVDDGVIAAPLGNRLRDVATLRNHLVFDYIEDDTETLFDRLDLVDAVEEFAALLRENAAENS